MGTKRAFAAANAFHAAPAAEAGTVRIGPTLAIPDVLASLGAGPARVLAEAGVDPAVFGNPDNRITFAARGRLMACCAAVTRCPHFGLLVGERSGLQGLGLVGLLARYSRDVGSALRGIERWFHIHVQGATTKLEVYGERALLSYSIYEPGVEGGDQLGDGAVAMMNNILRELCGPGWKPAGFMFARQRPQALAPYRKLLPAPLIFNAEQYGVVFPAAWLERAMRHDDPELRSLLQAQIDALEAQHGDDLVGRLRSLLRTALLTDHAGEEDIARLISIHPRTLSRRLAAEGTTFQHLVDECSFEIARQMLEYTRHDVAQIAASLDYADPSAFTRAFRRWSGTTPARWRAAQAGGHLPSPSHVS